MADPVRYAVSLVDDLPKFIADDIMSGLPRAAPQSVTEAMLRARRSARIQPAQYPIFDDQVRMLPREWDAAEVERYGNGVEYFKPPTVGRGVPNEWGDVPLRSDGLVHLPGRPQRARRVPVVPPRKYPFDADQVRLERRAANARAILEEGRQNPEIYDQLPAVFKLPIEDRLIARLASEGPSAYLPVAREVIDPKVAAARKFLNDHPELVGAAIVTGATLAYGLSGE